jgi:predicted dehydrogenase
MGRLIEDFGRAILLDRPVNGSFEDGLQCRRILDAAALAARERRWVEVGDVASTPCQALGSGS